MSKVFGNLVCKNIYNKDNPYPLYTTEEEEIDFLLQLLHKYYNIKYRSSNQCNIALLCSDIGNGQYILPVFLYEWYRNIISSPICYYKSWLKYTFTLLLKYYDNDGILTKKEWILNEELTRTYLTYVYRNNGCVCDSYGTKVF